MRYLCNGGSRDTEVIAGSAREAAEMSVARGDWGAVSGDVRVIVTRPDGSREWYRVDGDGVQAGGYWPGEVACDAPGLAPADRVALAREVGVTI